MADSAMGRLLQQLDRLGLDAELKELLIQSYGRMDEAEVEQAAGVLKDSLDNLNKLERRLAKLKDSDDIQ